MKSNKNVKIILGSLDKHSYGKNLVKECFIDNGFSVIDLNVEVSAIRFIETLNENPYSVLAISASINESIPILENLISIVRDKYPNVQIYVGGSAINDEIAIRNRVDLYSQNPLDAVHYLQNKLKLAV